MRLFIFAWILVSHSLFGIDFCDFDAYQCTLTAQEIDLKIKGFLEKDPEIRRWFRLTPEVFCIGDLERGEIDYTLRLRSEVLPQSDPSCHQLKNLRIALDPGHFGGCFADLEERLLVIPAEQTKSQTPIRLQEGDLTYLTALELKRLLEAEGALVMISRPGIGQGALKENFFQWRNQCSQNSVQYFSDYNKVDLRERAEKINAFAPDLTIVIHFNVDSEAPLTQFNYNLAFIPGAFCAGELKQPRDRYEFLRLIVTQDLERSLKLSESITEQWVAVLKIPLINQNQKTNYLDAACLFKKPGIYCRNLALTRLIHSPLCYGETLLQNNEIEIYRLSSHDISIGGFPCSKRIAEVAQAYFEGIKRYCKP